MSAYCYVGSLRGYNFGETQEVLHLPLNIKNAPFGAKFNISIEHIQSNQQN